MHTPSSKVLPKLVFELLFFHIKIDQKVDQLVLCQWRAYET